MKPERPSKNDNKICDRPLYRVSCVTIIELNLTKVENNKERLEREAKQKKTKNKWEKSI